MYETHYGFSEKPFNLTPDPKFLYLSARHTEAFAHLRFGHRERGGFVVITGEVGTGKTTLARYFLAKLGQQTDTAVVLYPAVTAAELLRSILDDLSATARGDSLKDLVDGLHAFLLETREKGRNVVLLIDEAQDLAADVLEQIRLISNLETDTEKLIQIVLMGQSELHEMLARHELRQISQRVTARYHLAPLSRRETADYVVHRLTVAGGGGKVQFPPSALRAVHSASRGVPRLINLICDRALLAGYVQGTRTIDASLVRRAAAELRGSAGLPSPRRRAVGLGAALVAGASIAAFVISSLGSAPAGAKPGTDAPAPEPAPGPQAAASPARGRSVLEPVLLSLPAEGSLQAALADVRERWGTGPVAQTALRTHLRHLRQLDLPVVLEMFHPQRPDACHVALLSIEDQSALVGTGSGVELRVPLEELDRHWTRRAVFLWRDFESLASEPGGARGRDWVRDRLTRLGYLQPGGELAEAVARFQRQNDLAADGLVGRRTLMTLYSRSAAEYPQPRLSGGSS